MARSKSEPIRLLPAEIAPWLPSPTGVIEATVEELRPLARALLSLAEQLINERDRDRMTAGGNRTDIAGQSAAQEHEV